MTSRSLPVLQDFPLDLAKRLLARLEHGAQLECVQPQGGGKERSARGWGRYLAPQFETSPRPASAQVGTFGTCDALRAIQGIQTACRIYYGPNRVVPSTTLEAIRAESYEFLRDT